MKPNGQDRITILQSDNLRHPINLDVFESSIYWVTRDSGELLRQDKFGRGVSVMMERNLVNPTSVLVWNSRKQVLGGNPCGKSNCTHLCLLIPGGARCGCPEGAAGVNGGSCDAPFER